MSASFTGGTRERSHPAAAPCDESVASGFGAALARMVAAADGRPCAATPFHSAWPPSVSIEDYVRRLRQYFRCSDESFVFAFAYVCRILQNRPGLAVDPLSCHRLAACSLLLAVKWHDDDIMSNADYAKVCGMSLQDLNHLERVMSRSLDYRLAVSDEEFDSHRRALARAGGRE